MNLSKKYNLNGGGSVQAKPCIVGGGGKGGYWDIFGKTQLGVCLFTSLTQFLFNKILPVYRKKL